MRYNRSVPVGLRASRRGTAIKAAVQVEPGALAVALLVMAKTAEKEKMLVGILQFLTAVDNRDTAAAEAAVLQMAEDHKKRMKRGVFLYELDQHLYVWGVGLINLARGLYGMDVHGHEPIMPDALLMPVRPD